MPPQAAAGIRGVGGLVPMGASPDGLGQPPFPQTPTVRYHAQPGTGMTLPIEPKDTSSGAAVQSAGFTALLSALAIGIGVATGGAYGAGAGLMLAGALANGYRAQKWINEQDAERRHEAVVSATFAVGELALGGYLAYRAYKAKKG